MVELSTNPFQLWLNPTCPRSSRRSNQAGMRNISTPGRAFVLRWTTSTNAFVFSTRSWTFCSRSERSNNPAKAGFCFAWRSKGGAGPTPNPLRPPQGAPRSANEIQRWISTKASPSIRSIQCGIFDELLKLGVNVRVIFCQIFYDGSIFQQPSEVGRH
jgi:hypothetical protein